MLDSTNGKVGDRRIYAAVYRKVFTKIFLSAIGKN